MSLQNRRQPIEAGLCQGENVTDANPNDSDAPARPPEPIAPPKTELYVYRLSWVVVVVMCLGSLLSSSFNAFLASEPNYKLFFYIIAAGLIGLATWMRVRIRKVTGQFPRW